MRKRVRVVHTFHMDMVKLDGVYVCTSVEDPTIHVADKDKDVASRACYQAIMERAKTRDGAMVSTMQCVYPGPLTDDDLKGQPWQEDRQPSAAIGS